MTARHGEHGQATVELVLLLPLVLAVAAGVAALLAAGEAREQADAAVHAAALAVLQDRDAAQAARAVLAPGERRRLELRVRGRSIRARVRPGVPLLGDLLTATARATAGPGVAPPRAPLHAARGGDGRSGAAGAAATRGALPSAPRGGLRPLPQGGLPGTSR